MFSHLEFAIPKPFLNEIGTMPMPLSHYSCRIRDGVQNAWSSDSGTVLSNDSTSCWWEKIAMDQCRCGFFCNDV